MKTIESILVFIIGFIIANYHPINTREFWIIGVPIIILLSIRELKV